MGVPALEILGEAACHPILPAGSQRFDAEREGLGAELLLGVLTVVAVERQERESRVAARECRASHLDDALLFE